jgi:hypothetical protein
LLAASLPLLSLTQEDEFFHRVVPGFVNAAGSAKNLVCRKFATLVNDGS